MSSGVLLLPHFFWCVINKPSVDQYPSPWEGRLATILTCHIGNPAN